jgi:choline dehydrogenase-like flavoprotein
MSVLDLKTHAHEKDGASAAVCVIGMSLPGLMLAMRLAQGGQKVIVLEGSSDG